jgi:hypothetical protein
MAHITKLAVIETMNAIWDYDPSEPDNCMLGGCYGSAEPCTTEGSVVLVID